MLYWVLLLIIILTCVEILLRKYFPQPDYFAREKRIWQYIPKSTLSNTTFTFNLKRDLYSNAPFSSWKKRTLHSNNYGFIGANIDKAKNPDEYRVFILCDSQLHGVMVPDDKKFLPLLQQAAEGKNINLFLVPQTAANTADILTMLSNKVILLEPDLIIINVGFNQHRMSSEEYKQHRPKILSTSTWMKYLLHEFAIFNFFARYVKFIRESTLYYCERGNTVISLYPTKNLPRLLFSKQDFIPGKNDSEIYQAYLQAMVGICKENNIKMGFVLQPNAYSNQTVPYAQISRVAYPELEMAKLLTYFEEVATKVCQAKNIPFLKFTEGQLSRDCTNFTDKVHLTEDGMRKMAEKIFDFICAIKEDRKYSN